MFNMPFIYKYVYHNSSKQEIKHIFKLYMYTFRFCENYCESGQIKLLQTSY